MVATITRVMHRLPILLLAGCFVFLYWTYPGQLDDVLLAASSAPFAPLAASIGLLVIIGATHYALLATHANVARLADVAAVSVPAVIVCLCFAKAAGSSWVLHASCAAIAIASLWLAANPIARNPQRWARMGLIAVTVGFVLCAFLTATYPVGFPRAAGSLPLLVFALGSYTVAAAALALRPRLAVMVVLIAALSLWLDPAQNLVRPVPHGENSQPQLDQALAEWLESRPDLAAYKAARKPYPVIVTSAEGGGIIAAAHAYTVLTGLENLCPSFAQHVFVSVGVSGGSLGNSLFAAKHRGEPPRVEVQPCRTVRNWDVARFDAADYLAPVLGTFLYVDIPNALMPGKVFLSDRAFALESAIEASGGDQAAAFYRTPIEDSWRPTDLVPAQVFVTTRVATGERFMFSPLYLAVGWYLAGVENSVSVSSAVALSARFPWITPSGRTVDGETTTTVADGGYYENSGAATAIDIVDSLRGLQTADLECGDLGPECGMVKFDDGCKLVVAKTFTEPVDWGCNRVIHLTYLVVTNSSGVFNLVENEPDQSFLLDPLRTMLNTRVARGSEAISNALGDFCSLLPCSETPTLDVGFHMNVVPSVRLGLPLGWSLSRIRSDIIRDFALPIAECIKLQAKLNPEGGPWSEPPRDEVVPALSTLREENGCALATIASLFNVNEDSNGRYYGIENWPWYGPD